MTRTLAACLVLALVVGTRLTGLAQTQEPASPVFRTGVDVVELDVTVIDRSTRLPVTSLTAADFVVREEGTPRPVVGFRTVVVPQASTAAESSWTNVAPDVVTNKIPEGRMVVVMLDRTVSAGMQAVTATKIARTIIDNLGPEDRAAVVHMAELAQPQNFTGDRARLLAAIESKAIGVNVSPGACPCSVCSHGVIRDVANALAPVGARQKMLFFIGNGLLLDPEPTSLCAPTQYQAIRDMFVAAQRANLAVYPISPAGVTTPMAYSAARRADGSLVEGSRLMAEGSGDPLSLRDLAADTGGRAVVRDNQPVLEVAGLFAESSSYYLLGFTPADGSGDAPRRIQVTVNRPNVDVRARRSYFPPTPSPRTPPRDGPNALPPVLANLLPTPAVPLTMSLVPVAQTGRGDAAIAAIIGVDASTVSSADGTLGVRVMAFDTRGRERASTRARIDVDASGVVGSYDVIARLNVPPGRYEVRAAIDAPGRDTPGSVYGYVDVPDSAREPLTVFGPFVSIEPGRTRYVPDDLRPLLPVVPTAVRTIMRTDRVTATVRIHQRRRHTMPSADVTMVLVNTRDEIVAEESASFAAEQFSETGRVDATFALPIERLASGEYLLRLKTTSQRHQVERTVRLRVE